jgi:hypothetical protein
MKHLLFALLCISALSTQAQFIEPTYFHPSTVKELTVVDTAGKVYSGKISDMDHKKQLMTELTIKVGDEKMVFTPETIRLVYAKATKISRMSKLGGSIQRMTKQKIRNKSDTLTFETVKNEDGEKILLQLINPGADSKIKVYANPSAGKTTSWTGIDGGMDRSYYVSKKGEPVWKLAKKDMKEKFDLLFGDCPSLKDKSKSWDDFDEYISEYDDCK